MRSYDINAEVAKGEVVVVCGPSGLWQVDADPHRQPAGGDQVGRSCSFDGQDVHAPMRSSELNQLRSRIGFVFQSFNLFPHLSALDNVMLSPIKVSGVKREVARDKAMALLDRVGLVDKAGVLSGAAFRRPAAARGYRTRAGDGTAGDAFRRAYQRSRSRDGRRGAGGHAQPGRDGMTMMCVTHEMGFAREVADRVWFMDAGRILETGRARDLLQRPQHPRAQRFLSDLRH